MMTNELNFNRETATEYDRGVRRTLPTYDALFRLMQAYFRQHIEEVSRVLIVGAGGGTELTTLGPANPNWTFTAVDPSQEMLTMARLKAEQLNLTDRVHFIEGLIDAVDETHLHDAATFMLVLHFIEDDAVKLQQLKNIRKHLKNGAPFVIAAMYGDRESEEFEALFALWKAYWLDTTNLSKEAVNDMAMTVRKLSFIPEEKIRALLTEAGFGSIAKFFTTNMFGGWICKAE